MELAITAGDTGERSVRPASQCPPPESIAFNSAISLFAAS